MTTAEKLTATGIAVNAIIASINIWWSVKQRKASQAALATASPVETPRRKRTPRLLSPMERRFIRDFRFMQVGLCFEVVTAITFPRAFGLGFTSWPDRIFVVLSLLSAASALLSMFTVEKHFIQRIKNYDSTFWKEIEDAARRLRE
jgi:hypothetical protein